MSTLKQEYSARRTKIIGMISLGNFIYLFTI